MSAFLLALESGGDQVGVALFRWSPGEAGELVAERALPARRDHGRQLLPLVDEACREAGIGAAAIAVVAVARGPGSYTGLRIGVATALGLAAAGGAAVVGVESLRAAAFAAFAPGAGPLAVLAAAGRGGIYAQVFDWSSGAVAPTPVGDARRIDESGVPGVLAGCPAPVAVVRVGDVARPREAGAGDVQLRHLPAPAVGRLAMALMREGVSRHEQALAVAPIYLRPAATAAAR